MKTIHRKKALMSLTTLNKYVKMKDILLWLSVKHIQGIGDVTFKKLIATHGNIEMVFNSIDNNSLKKQAVEKAKKELEKIEKNNVQILTYNDINYPENLKEIYSPPPLLYYYGNIEILSNKNIIAIVGSRNPTDYGKNVCAQITRELAELNVVTVSGMARGIDSIVHHETIKAGSSTISVLGCGINIIYPATNRNLFQSIRENGLILSEFPMGTKPEAGNFPKRNRIISALAKGVVVVEASMKSGSLITAEFALNQGKDIFAVPGNIYSYKSKGTHYLIKNGAYLVESASDIAEILFPEGKCKKSTAPCFESKELEEVYKLINEAPATIDELVLKTGLTVSELSVILTNLQILGHITEQTGKTYVANG
jgi:DNA processing protein